MENKIDKKMPGDGAEAHRNNDIFVTLGIFLIAVSIFLLTGNGRDYSGDGAQVFYTAESLLLNGSLEVDEFGPRIGALKGRDGHYFSKYPPAMTILEMPFYVALSAAANVAGFESDDRATMLRAWVPFVANAILTALILVVFYLVIIDLGYARGIALATTFLLGFTTPVWPYARFDLSEPLQTLCLLLAVWPFVNNAPGARGVFWSSCALVVLYLSKPLFVLLAPIIWVAWILKFETKDIKKLAWMTVVFGAPFVVAGLVTLLWNWLRFGNLTQLGYPEPFNTPLLIGLYGWFFSSGKSVFLYSPLLVLSAIFFHQFYRRHRFMALLIVAITVPIVIAYSLYWSWHGDWAWALRYALPLMPLWFLPLATMFAMGRRLWSSFAIALGAIGFFVQVLGVVINPANYLNVHVYQILPSIHPDKKGDLAQSGLDVHFIPEFSPIAGHWWLLKATVEQMRHPRKNYAKNRALRDYPWARLNRDWRPEAPQHAMGPDMWVLRPPLYMTSGRYWAAIALFSTLFAAGALLLIGSALVRRADRQRSRCAHAN